MIELFANIVDPDQTPRSAASDLSLHFLPVTLLGVSRLQWVNMLPRRNNVSNNLVWSQSTGFAKEYVRMLCAFNTIMCNQAS